MRVLLATNHKQLDSYLEDNAESLGITIIDKVYYREALADSIKRNSVDLVILSILLPGSKDIIDCIAQLRLADLRVIVLAGDLQPTDPVTHELIALGVYDILFNPVKLEILQQTIKEPTTLSTIVKRCKVPGKPKPTQRLTTLLEPEKDNSTIEKPITLLPKTRKEETSQQPPEHASEAEEIGFSKPHKPYYCVWSPASTGKTFVSVHLAKAFADAGDKVALVDLDLKNQGIWHWLLMPEGYNALNRALSAEVLLADRLESAICEGIQVFTRDPSMTDSQPTITSSALARLLNSNRTTFDVAVIDLPSESETTDWFKDLLEKATGWIMVADQDYSHVPRIREALKSYAGENYLVLNRYCGMDGWNTKEALGKKEVSKIPCLGSTLYSAIAHGKPLSGGNNPLADMADMLRARRSRGTSS